MASRGKSRVFVVRITYRFNEGVVDGPALCNVHAGETDAVTLNYDAIGATQRSRQIGGELTDRAHGVVIDAVGDIFVGGEGESGLDGDASVGEDDLSSPSTTAPGPGSGRNNSAA
jgi:hypothetical protein